MRQPINLSIPLGEGISTDAPASERPGGYVRERFGWSIRRPGMAGRAIPADKSRLLFVLPDGFEAVWATPVGTSTVYFAVRATTNHGRIYLRDDQGILTLLFTDEYDPSGDRLNFPTNGVSFDCQVEAEGGEQPVIYVDDHVNPGRVLRLGRLAATVHGLAQQPAVRWGDVTYWGLGSGTLPLGYYRYTVVYTNGYRRSAPFFLSREVVIAEKPAYADQPIVMGSPGVVTDWGFSIRVDQVDARWGKVELLVAYSPDNVTYTDLYIADRQTVSTAVDGALTLWCRSQTGLGESLPLQTVAELEAHILRSNGTALHKNYQIKAGVELGGYAKLNIPTPVYSPLIERQRAEDMTRPTKQDIAGNGTTTADDLVRIARAKRTPLADTPINQTVLVNARYTSAGGQVRNRLFPVPNERLDYSGVQFNHVRRDFRAGESYPIALAAVDSLGQVQWATPLGTYTFPAPDAPGSQTYPSEENAGPYVRHLGLRLDGLKLRRSDIFDDKGRQRIQGFSILVGDESGKLGPQGIVRNVTTEKEGRPDVFSSLPNWHNIFQNTSGAEKLLDRDGTYGVQVQGPESDFDLGAYRQAASLLTFHSPDLLTTPELLGDEPDATYLRVQGRLLPGKTSQQGVDVQFPGWYQFVLRTYGYDAAPTRAGAIGRVQPGDRTKIELSRRLPSPNTTTLLEKVYREEPAYSYSGALWPRFKHPVTGVLIAGRARAGGGHLLRTADNWMVDAGQSLPNPAGFVLASIEQAVEPPSTPTYRYVGHYQPLDSSVLADLPTEGTGADLTYVVNNLHVWGGRHYRQRTGIVLAYPDLAPGGEMNSSDSVPGGPFDADYGLGVLLVTENRYNHALRSGRRWETTGFNSVKQVYRNEQPFMDGAVHAAQPDDWFIQQGLQTTESVRTFIAPKPDTRLGLLFPSGIAWSTRRRDTSQYDGLIKFPASNLYLLDAEHGWATGVFALGMGLYVVQERAVVGVEVDQQITVPNDAGDGLLIASGREVGPHANLRTGVGSSRIAASWQGPGAVYLLDDRTGHLWRFTQAGFDDLTIRTGNRLLTEGELSAPATVWGLTDEVGRQVYFGRRGDSGRLKGHIWAYCEERDFLSGSWGAPSGMSFIALPAYGAPQLATLRGVENIGHQEEALLILKAEVQPSPGTTLRWLSAEARMSESLFASLIAIYLSGGGNRIQVPKGAESMQYRGNALYFALNVGDEHGVLFDDGLTIELWFRSEAAGQPTNWIGRIDIQALPIAY